MRDLIGRFLLSLHCYIQNNMMIDVSTQIKRAKVFLLVIFVIFSSCESVGKRITVRGRAYSWKRGAYIRTSKRNYYINGLSEWPDKYYENKLIVKGKLRFIKDTMVIIPDDDKQRFFGDVYIIDSAEYRISFFCKGKKPFKVKR